MPIDKSKLKKELNKGTLGKLNIIDAKMEGFNSKEEYLQYFEKVNGTRAIYTPIWIIKFKKLNEEELSKWK